MATGNPHFHTPGGAPRTFGPGGQGVNVGSAGLVPGQPPPARIPGQPQMSSPTKEVNTSMLCRIGQETVHDIVAKTLDIFNSLKGIQLPNGVSVTSQAYQDRKSKLDEQVKTVLMAFKKLRIIYDKVNENCASLEPTPAQDLIPVIENGEILGEKPRDTEAFKYVSEEHKDIVEQVQLKNQQLKEIIDQLRTIVWEINTMMTMRKT